MQRKEFQIASQAISLLLVLLATILSSGCSLFGGGPEPEFVPHVYLPDPAGKCLFIDGGGSPITNESAAMEEMYLAPLSDLDKLHTKIMRCKKWE